MKTSSEIKWSRYFRYDDSSGNLIWKSRSRDEFTTEAAFVNWKHRRFGKIAGSINKLSGRRCIQLFGKIYKAHRIVWEIHNGKIGAGIEIDHINRMPADNRIQNLRPCTRQQNSFNTRNRETSSTSLKGVCLLSYGKYAASITLNGKKVHLGVFSKKEDAYEVYKSASIKMHGKFSIFA